MALAQLWSAYNNFLLHLAQHLPEGALGNTWNTSGGSATLAFLVEDYYSHLALHTTHYAERMEQCMERAGLA